MEISPSLPALTPASYADYAAIAAFVASLGLYASRGITWDRPEKYDYLLYEKPQIKRGGAAYKRKEVRNIRRKIDESVCDPVKAIQPASNRSCNSGE